MLFGLLNLIALYLVTRLDPFTIKLAVIGALLTVSYPFLKRFFPLPQLYLGISFGGWSVLMAFAAQAGVLPRVAWVLYIAAVHVGGDLRHHLRHGRPRGRPQDRREVERHPVRRHGPVPDRRDAGDDAAAP